MTLEDYPVYRITWYRPDVPGLGEQTEKRRALNAADALTMWREEHYRRGAHPSNQPIVSKIELVVEPAVTVYDL